MVDKTKESTIKVLENPSDGAFPTTVRTYPPPGSFSEKQRQSSEGAMGGTVDDQEGYALKEFTYSGVFNPETQQSSLYDSTTSSLVKGMFDPVKPQSALLFAYGITNAGKSHTIMGSEKEPGIVPRTMKDIFTKMESHKGTELFMSYLEIYNDKIYDLLSVAPAPTRKGRVAPKRPTLKLQDNKGTINVKGLTKHKVLDTVEGLKLAATAKGRRQITPTDLNGVSSRSHSVCQLELVHKKSGMRSKKSSIFWIVDLAGSERSKRTGVGAQSKQQKEASGINTSLMKLWRCLKQLRSNQQQKAAAVAANQPVPKVPIVPFRESKLTHLFMNHLGGSAAGRTVMIVNVNPQPADYDETQHVLNSAAIAQSVKITNEDYMKKLNSNVATHAANGRSLKSIAESESKATTGGGRKRSSNTNRGRNNKNNNNNNNNNASMNSKIQQMANENDALRTALNSLKDRLFTAETEIREEVAEEFEERISEIHSEYAQQKKAYENSRNCMPTPARSVKKIESERTNEYIDELLEKIDECEDEMKRMRNVHCEEIMEKDRIIAELRGAVEEYKAASSAAASLVGQSAAGSSINHSVDEGDDNTVNAVKDGIRGDARSALTRDVQYGDSSSEEGDNKEAEKEKEKEKTVEDDDSDADDGDDGDDSVMDLVDDKTDEGAGKDCEKSSECKLAKTPVVVVSSMDTPKEDKPSSVPSDDDGVKVYEPNSVERKEIDRIIQEKKLRRLPRNRCSEVACVPVKKEKADAGSGKNAAGKDEENRGKNNNKDGKKTVGGFFAKFKAKASVKEEGNSNNNDDDDDNDNNNNSDKNHDNKKHGSRKRGLPVSFALTSSSKNKNVRKSLGEISNVSELTNPTVAGGKAFKGKHKKPRGRVPRGKKWDPVNGAWINK